ncbi:hypothetical protein NGRA_1426 [Nosema granulosis]|uniref:Uncharacterized protein n=1 Tax=Nosema granulosis TaxID=83296 RepID=A0A9P6KZ69_9MICR|nr:hypothetical protein NGRA_1426 [Nosema granulosis]
MKLFLEMIKDVSLVGIKSLVNYYEKNYISINNMLIKTNLVERLFNDVPLTTNVAESFNRAINSKFDTPSPNMCKFLKVIRSFQQETEDLILDLAMDPNQQARTNQDYSLKKENLTTVIGKYEKYTGLLFLKAITGINAGVIAEFDTFSEVNDDSDEIFED